MKLSITNFRGIKTAVLNLLPVTLISGVNGQGKSSIAGALIALLTGESTPKWCTKKDAIQLVNEGGSSGFISLETEGFAASISYPDIKIKATGQLPMVTLQAMGLDSPLNMQDKERARFISGLLKTDPSKEDFLAVMLEPKLWDIIETRGWDAAHKQVTDKGAELKGEWKHVTGETYGEVKAANWKPAGYTGRPEKEAQDALDIFKKTRDELIGKSAVRAAKTETDREEIIKIQEIIKQKPEFEKNLAVLREILVDTEADIASYKLKTITPVAPDVQNCPACKAPLMIQVGKIVPCKAVNKAELDATARAHNNIMAKVVELDSLTEITKRSIFETEQAIKVCDLKARELSALQAKPDTAVEPADTTKIDAQIRDLENDLACEHLYTEAMRYHERIMINKAIAEILSPEGLRLTALRKALDGFNAVLGKYSDKSKFGTVEITEALEFTRSDRNYRLLSDSEQYRVRCIVQLACAELAGSGYLLFDGADILDREGRNGLIQAAKLSGIPAMICMTITTREGMPDLSRVGGVSYWVENGVIV